MLATYSYSFDLKEHVSRYNNYSVYILACKAEADEMVFSFADIWTDSKVSDKL